MGTLLVCVRIHLVPDYWCCRRGDRVPHVDDRDYRNYPIASGPRIVPLVDRRASCLKMRGESRFRVLLATMASLVLVPRCSMVSVETWSRPSR